ncbi:hypothetical protein PLICRDRAFT_105411 [Plicaturopsis crispa FD-325 SS-3]|nr:hypothetical protein PLICRDRAFT_105411 [Plicaturopsis crispa FD-325 SS-3]
MSPSSDVTQLPRTLQRPAFADVPRANIAAVAPDLANVPREFVRRRLCKEAPQMLRSTASLNLPQAIPKAAIASTPSLSIPIRNASSTYPTHLLAISQSQSRSSPPELPLYATHSLVLATACSALPALPPSQLHPNATSLNLPILPLAVPAPAAFPALHAYLYTHDVPALLSALAPLPPTFLASITSAPSSVAHTLSSGPALHQLSAHAVHTLRGDRAALMGLAQRVNGLWKNACALGVHDPELWDAMDLAWEVVLGALNLAAGKA